MVVFFWLVNKLVKASAFIQSELDQVWGRAKSYPTYGVEGLLKGWNHNYNGSNGSGNAFV